MWNFLGVSPWHRDTHFPSAPVPTTFHRLTYYAARTIKTLDCPHIPEGALPSNLRHVATARFRIFLGWEIPLFYAVMRKACARRFNPMFSSSRLAPPRPCIPQELPLRPLERPLNRVLALTVHERNFPELGKKGRRREGAREKEGEREAGFVRDPGTHAEVGVGSIYLFDNVLQVQGLHGKQ